MFRQHYTRKPIVTYVLIIINVIIYILQMLTQRRTGISPLEVAGSLWPSHVLQGEWWRLFTSAWLHGSITHIGFNSLALFNQGRLVEPLLGHARYLFVYLLSGVMASIAIVIITLLGLTADGRYIGASACIMGIIGVGIFILWRAKQDLGLDTGSDVRQSLLWLLVQFGIDTVGNSSFLGHFFGALSGVLVGAPLVMVQIRAVQRKNTAGPSFGWDSSDERGAQ